MVRQLSIVAFSLWWPLAGGWVTWEKGQLWQPPPRRQHSRPSRKILRTNICWTWIQSLRLGEGLELTWNGVDLVYPGASNWCCIFGAHLDEAFHTSSYNSWIKQLIWAKPTTVALFTVKDFRPTLISTGDPTQSIPSSHCFLIRQLDNIKSSFFLLGYSPDNKISQVGYFVDVIWGRVHAAVQVGLVSQCSCVRSSNTPDRTIGTL